MKIGALVRVTAVPLGVLDCQTDDTINNLKARLVFESSVGRYFPIIDITDQGLIEIEVGEAVGKASYLHSIWIEPEYLELIETPA